ncbi:transmembrane protein 51a [Cyprinodon tularosa]|uniref:Transmembrane protein 51a n=1 Tax=Cyprinodon variegatus TaxID=28743 RepID=A0A3Q2CI11_CYPVA|nr:PREDICTED: transmembrane protein 51-like [Cyprinodon variegatus]XP_038161926.1 transmembrane protein 51a [Cyprinodon tularosa]XP_038161927.1 transmembrane protein 51a [Cyprinodon tularosa]
MRSTAEGPPCPPGVVETSSSNNNNNNNNNQMSSRENNGNSGSQYALCALGVGLIALGVVMIVWSIVPANTTFNSSSSGNSGGNGGMESKRHKASSVAFVLAGSGVAMLLLSLCLAMRNKQQERLRHQEVLNRREAEREQETETAEEQAQRYAVPSYEEVICSGQYPVRQSNLRPSVSQLPSYDELVQSDSIQYENEGAEVNTTIPQPALACIAPCATVSTSSHRSGRNNRNFLPIKIRRIKSEKLPMKNTGSSQPTDGISIEPLTPPPQYEDKVPPL